MKDRRPRIPDELAVRIDVARGDVPFERWVRRTLEEALAGESSVGASVETKDDPSRVEASKRPASPRAPTGALEKESPKRPAEPSGGEVGVVGVAPPRAPQPEVPIPKIARRHWS